MSDAGFSREIGVLLQKIYKESLYMGILYPLFNCLYVSINTIFQSFGISVVPCSIVWVVLLSVSLIHVLVLAYKRLIVVRNYEHTANPNSYTVLFAPLYIQCLAWQYNNWVANSKLILQSLASCLFVSLTPFIISIFKDGSEMVTLALILGFNIPIILMTICLIIPSRFEDTFFRSKEGKWFHRSASVNGAPRIITNVEFPGNYGSTIVSQTHVSKSADTEAQ
jgi:hypothetical protein